MWASWLLMLSCTRLGQWVVPSSFSFPGSNQNSRRWKHSYRSILSTLVSSFFTVLQKRQPDWRHTVFRPHGCQFSWSGSHPFLSFCLPVIRQGDPFYFWASSHPRLSHLSEQCFRPSERGPNSWHPKEVRLRLPNTPTGPCGPPRALLFVVALNCWLFSISVVSLEDEASM